MGVTFAVSSVQRATRSLVSPPSSPFDSRSDHRPFGRSQVEAWACNAPRLFPGSGHGFVDAVRWAFEHHYPLALSPDSVWLCIAQGVAQHLRRDPERLRQHVVRHPSKLAITVHRDDLVLGSSANDWTGVLHALSQSISEHVGSLASVLVCDFSTTGPVERTASEIVLMDAVSDYFDFNLLTLCGIPEVTLEGEPSDWQAILRRARALDHLNLGFWLEGLLPVLEKLAETAQGKVDRDFWQSFFKWRDESGGPYVCGWINVFFPYLVDASTTTAPTLVPNENAALWDRRDEAPWGGTPAHCLPSGVSLAPFTWSYLGTDLAMELLAGPIGVSQNLTTLALSPAIGWMVRHVSSGPPTRRSQAPEHQAADPMRGRERCIERRRATWFSGRISPPLMLTKAEVKRLDQQLADLKQREDLRFDCVLLAAPSGSCPFAPMEARLLVGTELSSGEDFPVFDLSSALARPRLAEADWANLSAAIGGLSETTALHVACCGDAVAVVIHGGYPSPTAAQKVGMDVLRVSAEAPHRILEVPADGHESRLEALERLGVARPAAAYYLRVDGELHGPGSDDDDGEDDGGP